MLKNTEAIICFTLFSHQYSRPILIKLNAKFKTN